MLEITHSNEPVGLKAFRELLLRNGIRITRDSWKKFSDYDQNASRRELKQTLFHLQHGCCAYCERKIQKTDCHIDHVEPRGRSETEHLTLTFSNMVISCNSQLTCGTSKHHHRLPIQPRPGANENFQLIADSGKLQPSRHDTAAHARSCIYNILNLNSPYLCEERRLAVIRIRNNMQRLKEMGLGDEIEAYLSFACRPGVSYSPTLANFFRM